MSPSKIFFMTSAAWITGFLACCEGWVKKATFLRVYSVISFHLRTSHLSNWITIRYLSSLTACDGVLTLRAESGHFGAWTRAFDRKILSDFNGQIFWMLDTFRSSDSTLKVRCFIESNNAPFTCWIFGFKKNTPRRRKVMKIFVLYWRMS